MCLLSFSLLVNKDLSARLLHENKSSTKPLSSSVRIDALLWHVQVEADVNQVGWTLLPHIIVHFTFLPIVKSQRYPAVAAASAGHVSAPPCYIQWSNTSIGRNTGRKDVFIASNVSRFCRLLFFFVSLGKFKKSRDTLCRDAYIAIRLSSLPSLPEQRLATHGSLNFSGEDNA